MLLFLDINWIYNSGETTSPSMPRSGGAYRYKFIFEKEVSNWYVSILTNYDKNFIHLFDFKRDMFILRWLQITIYVDMIYKKVSNIKKNTIHNLWHES